MELIQLDSETSPYFESLTFPNYSLVLKTFSTETHLAVGALTDDSLPIGLVLVGKSHNQDKPHEILSLYVDDDYRQQGVATALLTTLRDVIMQDDVPFIKGNYPDDLPDAQVLHRAFISSGYSLGADALLTIRGSIRIGMELVPDVIDLPDGVFFRDWASLTDDDRAQIVAYTNNWEETDAHYPFYDVGVPIHDETSILLCSEFGVIGWMVNHEVEANVIRYSRLFIAPDWRKQRLGVRCFFEAMRRHYAYNPDSDALFAAESHNTPMLAVIEYFRSNPHAHFSTIRHFFWRANRD